MSTVLAAIPEMSEAVQAVCYLVALVCFFVVIFKVSSTRPEIFWIALGLAWFVFVFFWLALQAA